MGEPFLLVLVKMAENMRPTNEDAFLCRRPVSAEPQPTRGGAGETALRGTAGARGGVRCFLRVSAGTSAASWAPGPLRKLGGLLLVSHRRARTGARGQRRRGRAQGRGPAGPEAAAPRPGSAGRLCVFGRAREDRTRAETKTNVYKPAKREP